MTAKAIITGGDGFVGSHLRAYLLSQGWRVALLGNSGGQSRSGELESYNVDIRDAHEVAAAMQQARPTHVFHLAAISSVPLSWRDPKLTYEVNVLGTFSILQAAAHLPSFPRLLNVSTAQVYARSSAPLNEDSPLSPENPYAISKAMTELLLRQYAQYDSVISVRAFNHAGPGQSPDYVLSSLTKQFAQMETGVLPTKLAVGNTHVKRDFTDVRDVVRAYVLLLERGRPNETYNVCSGRAVSIESIIKDLSDISGVVPQTETQTTRQRVGEVEIVCGNAGKILRDTGWTISIPLRDTLADMLSHWKEKLVYSSSEEPQPHAPRC